MGATEELARFACELRMGSVPEEAFSWAKSSILDCIGVGLAGAADNGGRIMTEYARESAGKPEAGVLAGGFKTCAASAALANGMLVHALDFDDYALPNWMGHPTAPIVPSILALGQRQKISGKQALLAYVIGFEVGGRVGAGVGRMHYELTGWHPTATLGTMGATAACSRILNLDLDRTRNALGIACSEASGLRTNFGTNTKPLHAGLANRNGVLAALLAEKGFTADVNGIEAPLGFSKVATPSGSLDLDKITKGLGKSFLILEHGISIKPYPCCADGHRCIDAMFYMADKYNLRPEDIELIECRTSDVVPKIMIRNRPQTGAEGKFSMQYCMAAVLIYRKLGLRQFTTESVMNPKVQELLKRVKFVHPPEYAGYEGMELNPEQVIVHLKNGTVHKHEVFDCKGKPGNRLSEAELAAKLRDCASLAVSPARIDRSLEMLHELDKLQDINPLMDVLCTAEASGKHA